MVQITRKIDGQDMVIVLTEKEMEKVRRHDKIQWAKNILENYAEMLVDYESVCEDEEKLVEFADRLEAKCLEDNGEEELEVLCNLFAVYENI